MYSKNKVNIKNKWETSNFQPDWLSFEPFKNIWISEVRLLRPTARRKKANNIFKKILTPKLQNSSCVLWIKNFKMPSRKKVAKPTTTESSKNDSFDEELAKQIYSQPNTNYEAPENQGLGTNRESHQRHRRRLVVHCSQRQD